MPAPRFTTSGLPRRKFTQAAQAAALMLRTLLALQARLPARAFVTATGKCYGTHVSRAYDAFTGRIFTLEERIFYWRFCIKV